MRLGTLQGIRYTYLYLVDDIDGVHTKKLNRDLKNASTNPVSAGCFSAVLR